MGHDITIEIVHEKIDSLRYQEAVGTKGSGAIFSFLGTVRDNHYDREVLMLDYKAYESMAIKQMTHIATAMQDRWPINKLSIIHRLGRLEVGEASILICFSMPHRKEGFEALQYAIDTFKEIVPIWKKEYFADGEAIWVEGS